MKWVVKSNQKEMRHQTDLFEAVSSMIGGWLFYAKNTKAVPNDSFDSKIVVTKFRERWKTEV